MTGLAPGRTVARLLVIEPDAKGTLDNFEGWLSEQGIEIRTVRPYTGQRVPADFDAVDAVLVLGGSMSSLDDETYPWLEDIRAALRQADRLGRPALGICLGAQLMAQAHGGLVMVGRHGTEGGLISVRWLDGAGDDALVGGLPDPFPVGALHGDAIEVLPPSAIWLASNDRYPHQAFRVGEQSWGLQFHPEVTVATMRMWLSGTDREATADIDQLDRSADEFEDRQAAVVQGTAVLAQQFGQLVTAARLSATGPSIWE